VFGSDNRFSSARKPFLAGLAFPSDEGPTKHQSSQRGGGILGGLSSRPVCFNTVLRPQGTTINHADKYCKTGFGALPTELHVRHDPTSGGIRTHDLFFSKRTVSLSTRTYILPQNKNLSSSFFKNLLVEREGFQPSKTTRVKWVTATLGSASPTPLHYGGRPENRTLSGLHLSRFSGPLSAIACRLP
jgi:hypothetical protein